MATHLLDTDVAIHWRDGNREVEDRIAGLSICPSISILTQVELEGGVVRAPELASIRRANVDAMLAAIRVLPFDYPCALAYREILAVTGWARARIFDRMIAATAIVHGLTLITMNGPDFDDIAGLKLETWPSPAGR
jgi:tRNA(fMet)-specific endonuclease VapC